MLGRETVHAELVDRDLRQDWLELPRQSAVEMLGREVEITYRLLPASQETPSTSSPEPLAQG